jgi:exodeoxyribonuclease-3
MKIASWNINSLRKRQDRLFDWLEATRPDIVCLQETKCPDDQFPALALQAVGYRVAYHGEKSYNGVAILAKGELREVCPSLCDEVVDPQARVIVATIGHLRVFSIYAPNGQAVGSPAYEYKLQWYRRLRDCVAKEKSVDVIVCGDFNVAPEDIDVYDPDLWRGAIMGAGFARHAANSSQGRRTFQLVGLSDASVRKKSRSAN